MPSETIPKAFSPGYEYTPGTIDLEQLKVFYLFGIDLSGPEGDPFPDELLQANLDGAIQQVQNILDIQISELAIVGEQHDYNANDFKNWGYMDLWKRPVQSIQQLRLMYGNQPSFVIPNDWVKVQKNVGQISLFPSQGSAGGLIIGSTGLLLGLNSMWNYAPYAWEIDYTAGWAEGTVPGDIRHLVYMYACIAVMTVWGDLIIGAGIASQSIGIDGLSQSVSTTQSAMFGGASGRIESYRKDIEILIPILRRKYSGIPFAVL